jgi:hypothetical protein
MMNSRRLKIFYVEIVMDLSPPLPLKCSVTLSSQKAEDWVQLMEIVIKHTIATPYIVRQAARKYGRESLDGVDLKR